MNAVTGRWWLAAHVAPSRPDAEVEVAIQRELDAVEVQRTSEANAFVRRLASVAPYALLVKLYHELEQIMARELSARRRASELNRAARALGKAAGDLVADLRRSSRNDFDPGSKQNQELQRAIVQESERAEFRLLVAVGQLEQGFFAAVENTVTIDADAVAALGDLASRVQSMVEVVGSLRSGIVVAQRLMGRQLLIYRERIEGVSLFLRRLAAEVADGAPTLVWSDRFDPEHGEMSLGQARFDSLALDQARYLHRALRQVPTLLEATNSGRANETHAGTRGQLTESDADPFEDDLTATTQAVAGAQPPTASDAVTGSPPGDREDQVVDLRALARHATAFTDELERAWSAALDSVLLAEAQQEMGARYESLLRTIARRAAAADRALSTAGVDPGLPAHPLQPDELARLTFDPTPKQRWLQRQLAEIDTLTTLLEALKAISAPSAHMIHVHKQRVESWWEAGAFALIRDCADLLLRVSEQVASAEAELTGTSVTPTPPPAFVGRLQLASAALRHGDIEAVLMHARLALRLRAAVEHDVVPDDLLERLTQDGRLADDATVLRLLDQAASRLAAGEELDIGAAMLLAPRALAVVHRLCLQTPQIILSALEKGSGHAGG